MMAAYDFIRTTYPSFPYVTESLLNLDQWSVWRDAEVGDAEWKHIHNANTNTEQGTPQIQLHNTYHTRTSTISL